MMSRRIFRPYSEPKREGLTWEERWQGDDRGLITCWEVGRQLREKAPEIARRAENGELPVLGWKGGVNKSLECGVKRGTLYYLAQWQGLRADDLDIDWSRNVELICTKTGMRVIYGRS